MLVEGITAALVASVWTWSMASARVIKLAMDNNLGKLPLWAVAPKGYLVLTIVNVLLVIAQCGIPIAVLFLFKLTTAVAIIVVGIVSSWLVDFALHASIRNEMIKYFVSSLLVAAFSASIAIIV